MLRNWCVEDENWNSKFCKLSWSGSCNKFLNHHASKLTLLFRFCFTISYRFDIFPKCFGIISWFKMFFSDFQDISGSYLSLDFSTYFFRTFMISLLEIQMILIYLIRVVYHALLFHVAYHIMGCLCRCCVSYCACAYHQQLSDTNRQLT